MLQRRSEELLGQSPGWGRRRRSCSPGWPANCRQGTRVQPQRVANAGESQGVGQLGVEEADHMAPRTKWAGLSVYPGVPGQLRHEMSGSEIAELVQQRDFAARWLEVGFAWPTLWQVNLLQTKFFFHPLLQSH